MVECLNPKIFLILINITCLYAIQYAELPSSGVCPSRMTRSSSVFLPKTNQILTFGGRIAQSGEFSSSLYTFSLDSNKWNEIAPKSEIRPPKMYNSKLFIHSSRFLILLFGCSKTFISSTIYKFDLDSHIWSTTLLSGDTLPALEDSSSCLFVHNQIEYFAIFGGLSLEGVQNSLYL